MSVAAGIRRMIEAGLTLEQALTAAEIMESEAPRSKDEQAERRRAKDRERKRLRKSAETVESAETAEQDQGASRAHVVILSSEEEERTIPTVCQESSPPIVAKPTAPVIAKAFGAFWAAYPQRKGANPRKPALDKFAAAVRAGFPPEQIIGAAGRYADECRSNSHVGTPFVAQAVTWINQRRFEDYAAPPAAEIEAQTHVGWRPGLPTHEELLAEAKRMTSHEKPGPSEPRH